jgi:hypothetical protein
MGQPWRPAQNVQHLGVAMLGFAFGSTQPTPGVRRESVLGAILGKCGTPFIYGTYKPVSRSCQIGPERRPKVGSSLNVQRPDLVVRKHRGKPAVKPGVCWDLCLQLRRLAWDTFGCAGFLLRCPVRLTRVQPPPFFRCRQSILRSTTLWKTKLLNPKSSPPATPV